VNDGTLLSPLAAAFMVFYLLGLLLIGWIGKRVSRERSLSDFFLAGRQLGLATLFLTLYATQYSGSTLVGMAAKAYRQGFTFVVSVTFMVGIIAVYWLYAPRLQRLATQQKYITPGDVVKDRFQSRKLVLVLNLIFVLTLASFILANLKAMGHVVEIVSVGAVPFAWAIVLLSVVMVAYESLGGMRSVAWTDALQGLILLLGTLAIFHTVIGHYGGLDSILERLRSVRPEFWEPPDARQKLSWFSVLILVSFGAAVYPQAIQRIYAAPDGPTLKRALQFMLVMPLVTTLFVVVIGIVGVVQFPALDRAGSEQITLLMLTDLAQNVPELKWLLVLFIAAVVGAIMSTVDSALLSLSSILTQDFIRPRMPQSSAARLTLIGKALSWGIMAAMAWLAIGLPQTIWQLTVIKLELLVQAAPTILLGVLAAKRCANAMVAGVVTGVVVSLSLMFAGQAIAAFPANPLGIDAGVWGLVANVLTVCCVSRLLPQKRLSSVPP
jgi:Na+/proline symporter